MPTQTLSRPFQTATFVTAYVTALLWTGVDSFEGRDVLLDSGEFEVAPEVYARAENDCAAFLAFTQDLIPEGQESAAGHDFALTRNLHGCGFWARPELYGVQNAATLTDIAHDSGEIDLYIGDDRLIHA